jgi:phosphate transport system permease protein
VTAAAAAVVPDRPHGRKRRRDQLPVALVPAVPALALASGMRLVLDWHGILSTAIWAAAFCVAGTFVVVRDKEGDEVALDRTITALVWSAGGIVFGALAWMLGFLVVRGLPALQAGFFVEDMSKVGPLNPGGGAFHAIVGSAEQVGLATVVVVPLAVLTAVYLHEIRGRMAGLLRFVVDAMAGLPSIVAGLLVFTVWVTHHGFSGFTGSAALVVLMLPTVTRTSEEILRTIPDSLREASLALGAPEWRVVLRVVLPTAASGLMTAVILGIARAVGETAPMLLTALGSDSTNVNPFKGPQADLPLFIWKLIPMPNKIQQQRGATGALVLVGLVLVLFVAARVFAARSQRKLGGSR